MNHQPPSDPERLDVETDPEAEQTAAPEETDFDEPILEGSDLQDSDPQNSGAQGPAAPIFDPLLPEPDENERLRRSADLRARQIIFYSRAAALAFTLCLFIGWPLGSSWAQANITGQWRLVLGFTPTLLLLGLLVPICFLFLGLILSHFAQLTMRAEALDRENLYFVRPETKAVEAVQSVGSAVRGEIQALNENLDDALAKLATAESMIRQQVSAIEAARQAIDGEADSFTAAVARERENLMTLTEKMSAEADAFAEAIALQAQNSLDKTQQLNQQLSDEENTLQTRLDSLENAAENALGSLASLSDALEEQENKLSSRAASSHERLADIDQLNQSLDEKITQESDALIQAKEKLAEESARLEELIAEQQERAGRLADVITTQVERLNELSEQYQSAEEQALSHAEKISEAAEATQNAIAQQKSATARLSISDIQPDEPAPTLRPASKPKAKGFEGFIRGITGGDDQNNNEQESAQPSLREERHATSWSKILAAADERDSDVLDLQPEHQINPEENADDASGLVEGDVVDRIRKMQRFTLHLIEELYGPPPSSTIERFEGGERNIFAHLLLRRNEEDVKLRLQNRANEDLDFREAATQFLTEFDTLLEPATGATNSETLLDDYLASPLGQVYIIVGSALDYFA